MSQTAAAGVCDLVAAHRTFVARGFDDLDNVRVVPVAAHCQLDAVAENGAFFIDAAAHGRCFAGNDDLRNVHDIFRERAVPRKPRDLTQNLIF